MGNALEMVYSKYYTPRPLIRAIIDIVSPKIGETVYDGAVGSKGFYARHMLICYLDGMRYD